MKKSQALLGSVYSNVISIKQIHRFFEAVRRKLNTKTYLDMFVL